MMTSAILGRVSDANATGANGAAAPAAPAAPEQTHELLARINLFAGLSPDATFKGVGTLLVSLDTSSTFDGCSRNGITFGRA